MPSIFVYAKNSLGTRLGLTMRGLLCVTSHPFSSPVLLGVSGDENASHQKLLFKYNVIVTWLVRLFCYSEKNIDFLSLRWKARLCYQSAGCLPRLYCLGSSRWSLIFIRLVSSCGKSTLLLYSLIMATQMKKFWSLSKRLVRKLIFIHS